MGKLLFRPVGVVGGIVAGIFGRRLFQWVWTKADDEEPPDPKHRDIAMPRLVVALLLEGAVYGLVRGLFDHGSRRVFYGATGNWPGEIAPDGEL